MRILLRNLVLIQLRTSVGRNDVSWLIAIIGAEVARLLGLAAGEKGQAVAHRGRDAYPLGAVGRGAPDWEAYKRPARERIRAIPKTLRARSIPNHTEACRGWF